MLFRIPVTYMTSFTRPRCRNSERVLCGEWIEVDVRETTDLDAPVAMRWREKSWQEPEDGGLIRETRWHDGHHYVPCLDGEDEALSASDVADLCAQGRSYANPLVSSSDWQVRDLLAGKIKPLSEIPVRSIESSERDEAIATAMAQAAGLLIVDGMMWDIAGEPVYEYNRNLGIEVKHLSLPTDRRSDESRKALDRFRADRLDDIVEHFQATQDEINEVIDILIPESVRYDDETPAIIETARLSVDNKPSSYDLDDLPKHVIMAWVDLRDAYRALTRTPDPEAIDSLVEIMRVYSETCEDGWQKDRLRSGLSRWDLRPMSVDSSFSPSV